MLARSLVLFALALCACGTTTTNTQPPVPAPEETSDPALNAELEKTLKASEELNKSLEEAEQETEEAKQEIEEAKRKYDEDKRKLTNPDQPAPQEQQPQTEDPPQKPQIKTVVLTGKPLKVDRYDLATLEGLKAFVDLARQRSDNSPMMTTLVGITSYSHSVCWTAVGGGMIFSDCLLYRLEGNTAVVLHLQGGLDTIVGYFTGPEGEYTYSCKNDSAMRGRNCYLVNLTTGATSKNEMFLYSHPKVLVSPAGVVYLNDTVHQDSTDFYDRIYTPDGTMIANSNGHGDFTFVAEAVIEKPVYERWTPGVSMADQLRRARAEQIDLTNGHKIRIYDKE